MSAAFDAVAANYDASFTDTPIGRAQRARVWRSLTRLLAGAGPRSLLELNCGTGVDALWLAQQGHTVQATDISSAMVAKTQERVIRSGLAERVRTTCIDTLAIDPTTFPEPFDLVFSNFGGLNCIAGEALVAWSLEVLPQLLRPGGSMVAVIMPRHCLWEGLYFTLRGQQRRPFRRDQGPLAAQLGEGAQVRTWYHDSAWLARALAARFELRRRHPIGIALPPSYFHGHRLAQPAALRLWQGLEQLLGGQAILADWSDHYLIQLTLSG